MPFFLQVDISIYILEYNTNWRGSAENWLVWQIMHHIHISRIFEILTMLSFKTFRQLYEGSHATYIFVINFENSLSMVYIPKNTTYT